MNISKTSQYGEEDASYQAIGGLEGIRQLVDDFYDIMAEAPEFSRMLNMHPADLTTSRDKLTLFLSGWLGGPRLFAPKYGPIRIPIAHRHLDLDEADRDAWLVCMYRALEKREYPQEFKAYLIEQLAVPAERIRLVSEDRQRSQK